MMAACAAAPPAKTPAYVPPGEGPTARLIMRGTVFAGESYEVVLYADGEQCQQPQLAGGIGTSTTAPKTTTFAAGQLTTIGFTLSKPNRPRCIARWSFVPEAGKSYLVAGASLPAGCSVRLLDASDPDAIKVERSAVRRNSSTSLCLPLAQARAAAGATASGSHAEGEAVLRPDATDRDLQGLVGQ